jgi:predicted transposase YdaD
MTTYAQELLAEGRAEGEQKGTIRTQMEVIEGLLREGVEWPVIERATGVNEVQFQALKQQVEAMDERDYRLLGETPQVRGQPRWLKELHS